MRAFLYLGSFSMAITGFNHDKCAQRNRVAGGRFGIDTAPLEFKTQTELNKDFLALKQVGKLPETPQDALKAINASLPEGATELQPEDVYIHFLEAANSNFIDDRFAFLHESTLRNIAKDAKKGIAFMNSHRTGGMSSPTELPFGQTFAGMYEQGLDGKGNPMQRTTVAVFMRRGIQPNGANGPSTDDLHVMVESGSLKDVSVGLRGGEVVCDVCGHEYGDYEKCQHYAGTTEGMTADEIDSQKQRSADNKKGVATYSWVNASFGEISAVYDGAIRGAGVQKVMNFARTHDLSKPEVRAFLLEAFETWGPLLPFDLGELVTLKPENGNSPRGKNMANENHDEPTWLQKLNEKLDNLFAPREPAQGQPVVLPIQAQLGAAPAISPEIQAQLDELATFKAKQESEAVAAYQSRLDAFKTVAATKIAPAALKSDDNPEGFDLDAAFAKFDKAGLSGDLNALFASAAEHPLFKPVPTPATVIASSAPNAADPNAVDQGARKVALQNIPAGQEALNKGVIQIPATA